MTPAELYLNRSIAHTRARAFRQGALDADLAMAALGARDGPRWAEAWYRRGEACAASHGHPDLDWGGAVKAYTRAVDLDPDNGQYQEALRFAGGSLGPEQMSKVPARAQIVRTTAENWMPNPDAISHNVVDNSGS